MANENLTGALGGLAVGIEGGLRLHRETLRDREQARQFDEKVLAEREMQTERLNNAQEIEFKAIASNEKIAELENARLRDLADAELKARERVAELGSEPARIHAETERLALDQKHKIQRATTLRQLQQEAASNIENEVITRFAGDRAAAMEDQTIRNEVFNLLGHDSTVGAGYLSDPNNPFDASSGVRFEKISEDGDQYVVLAQNAENKQWQPIPNADNTGAIAVSAEDLFNTALLKGSAGKKLAQLDASVNLGSEIVSQREAFDGGTREEFEDATVNDILARARETTVADPELLELTRKVMGEQGKGLSSEEQIRDALGQLTMSGGVAGFGLGRVLEPVLGPFRSFFQEKYFGGEPEADFPGGLKTSEDRRHLLNEPTNFGRIPTGEGDLITARERAKAQADAAIKTAQPTVDRFQRQARLIAGEGGTREDISALAAGEPAGQVQERIRQRRAAGDQTPEELASAAEQKAGEEADRVFGPDSRFADLFENVIREDTRIGEEFASAGEDINSAADAARDRLYNLRQQALNDLKAGNLDEDIKFLARSGRESWRNVVDSSGNVKHTELNRNQLRTLFTFYGGLASSTKGGNWLTGFLFGEAAQDASATTTEDISSKDRRKLLLDIDQGTFRMTLDNLKKLGESPWNKAMREHFSSKD